MKKFLKLNVVALMSSILLTGCAGEAENKLKKAVEKSAEQCPVKVAEGVTIDSIEYSNDMVTYYSSVANGYLQIPVLKDESDQIRHLIVQAISSSESPEIREQLQLCADAGACIVMAFTDRMGNTYDLRINPADYIQKNDKTEE